MRALKGLRCCGALLLFSVLLLPGGGCETARQSLFTASGPGWKLQQGQALWRPRRALPEVAGDLVFGAGPGGRWFLEFDKTPLTLVSAQSTSHRWLIRFPPRHLGFSGHPPPSKRFAWLYLPRALAGERLPAQFRFEKKPDGSWRLENTRSGELLKGFLAP